MFLKCFINSIPSGYLLPSTQRQKSMPSTVMSSNGGDNAFLTREIANVLDLSSYFSVHMNAPQ